MTKIKTRRVPATTNNITKGIINYINSKPECFAFRVNNGGVYDPVNGNYRTAVRAGISDIIACIRGKFVAIEVKNKITRDTLKPAQVAFGVDVNDAKGEYIIAGSYETFVRLFDHTYGI